MIKKIKFFLISLAASGLIAVPVAAPTMVAAQLNNQTSSECCGAQLQLCSNGGTGCTNTTGSLNNIIKWALNIFSVIVGITAVIMIVVGGFKYIVSGGESSKVSGAKDTILFAIVGLVVVALAQIIVHFVLSSVHGQTNL